VRRLRATVTAWFLLAGAVSSAEAATCDRECLNATADRYLMAVLEHTPQSLALPPAIKYTENQDRVAVGEGLWQSAQAFGTYRIYAADVRMSQIAFLGTVKLSSGWSMFAVRLRVQEGKISEIEAIIPGLTAAAGTFDVGNGLGNLKQARAPFAVALKPAERRDRSQLIGAADLHYEGIERGNGDIVPFGEHCVKVENGVQLILNPAFPYPAASPSGQHLPNFAAMSCHDQFNTHVWDTDSVTDRRYPVVDEERGIVVAFAMYNQYIKGPCANVVDYGAVCPPKHVEAYSLVMAEAFKVRGGLIEEVESIWTVLPTVRRRGVW
jgi:hypothetical protein